MRETPVCWQCHENIDKDWVFESPCGHDDCVTATFHGLCLMQWREHRENMERQMRDFFEQHREMFEWIDQWIENIQERPPEEN